MCCVYLIHLSRPYRHSSHYVGWSKDLDRRLAHHAYGTGARFLAVVREAGITWQLARVWDDADKTFERRLKNTHSVRDYCPVCSGEKARSYRPKTATQVTPNEANHATHDQARTRQDHPDCLPF